MSWNQAHALLLIESFLTIPSTQSEASQCSSGSHNYETRENKLPSFIDRYSPKFVYRPNMKAKQNLVIKYIFLLKM